MEATRKQPKGREQKSSVNVNKLTIEFETIGDRSNAPLLLVMGLRAQMIVWDEEFFEQLDNAGHFIIQYDNRNVGLSTYCH